MNKEATIKETYVEAKNPYYVKIETPYGDMKVRLYDETPLHRDNFVKLVRQGFYDSLLFHRVIRDFMIQGGDPQSKNAAAGTMLGNGTTGYTIPAEFNPALMHKKGALAAARMGDPVNPKKESSGCQFYIVQGNVWDTTQLQALARHYGKTMTKEQMEVYSTVGGTPHLDGEYTVFGEVVEGLDVIDKIAAEPCDRADRPVKDVRMKITLVTK
ncbi:MAG: peptidylprolyl isomerase [Bacteroidales bacterium]|nr:peptidylprolyl isomerase [Bacteroidales bacterium]